MAAKRQRLDETRLVCGACKSVTMRNVAVETCPTCQTAFQEPWLRVAVSAPVKYDTERGRPLPPSWLLLVEPCAGSTIQAVRFTFPPDSAEPRVVLVRKAPFAIRRKQALPTGDVLCRIQSDKRLCDIYLKIGVRTSWWEFCGPAPEQKKRRSSLDEGAAPRLAAAAGAAGSAGHSAARAGPAAASADRASRATAGPAAHPTLDTSSALPAGAGWDCRRCTLLNLPDAVTCAACDAEAVPRTPRAAPRVSPSALPTPGLPPELHDLRVAARRLAGDEAAPAVSVTLCTKPSEILAACDAEGTQVMHDFLNACLSGGPSLFVDSAFPPDLASLYVFVVLALP